MDALRRRLNTRVHTARMRARSVRSGRATVHHNKDGVRLLSFCSNDYLGLASDKRIIEACCRGMTEYGVGSGAAFLISGYTPAHRALEERLAELLNRDRVVLFSTGYMANLGVLGVLADRDTHVYCDRLNHASLLDGVALARARLRRYPHLDVRHLEKQLAQQTNETEREGSRDTVIVTESVFGMDGDEAPLRELAKAGVQAGCALVVDEAHSFGIVGRCGAGMCYDLGLTQEEATAVIGTFGKACGTFGAFVAASGDLIEALIQFARSYIYTTAPPPAIACATLAALDVIRDEEWRREKLFANITRFRALSADAGFSCLESRTAIQCVLAHDDARARQWSRLLFEQGIDVRPICPPTVPEGQARLRVTLSAAHEASDIERLVEALAQCCRTDKDNPAHNDL